jgi:hypothetical protein
MNPYLKITNHKNMAGPVTPGVDPDFKPQYHKQKRNDITYMNIASLLDYEHE